MATSDPTSQPTSERLSENATPEPPSPIPQSPKELFVGRELSWLQFDRRVLEEAKDPTNPLLERVKFLAIASTNLDEFFEIRVAGIMELVDAGLPSESPDGLSAREELTSVLRASREFTADMHETWTRQLVPALADEGIHLLDPLKLEATQRAWVRRYFEQEVLPVLTPLAVDPAHPFPSLLNKSLNLAVLLLDPREERVVQRIAVVQVPRVLPRLVRLPDVDGEHSYVFMVDIIREHLDVLFPGLSVLQTCSFRVTRDSNLDLDERQNTDLIQALEIELDRRRRGEPVRLEISRGAHEEIVGRFLEAFNLVLEEVHECSGPVNLGRLMELYDTVERPDLKDPPFRPRLVATWDNADEMFAAIRERDLLLHHPYDSFATVEEFVRRAASDPRVFAIKHTIYRAGETSPIVRDLIQAAEDRKQVTVVVELKARFDEEANIRWAKRMEQAGIHVVYGIVGLKTHSKITLIVRREESGMRRYCHLGSGNYNPTTARIYTDIGLITGHEQLCREVADLFNMITGYARAPAHELLQVSPYTLRSKLNGLIDREIDNARAGKHASIRAKMNSLVDQKVIRKLYEASCAGVRVELAVRGICCLRPGIPGVSENISVLSVVERFLEHSRIFYFHNHGGTPDVYSSSADWMPRNLDRRVEAAFPILDPTHRERVVEILECSLRDNVKGRWILADGGFERRVPGPGETPFRSQEHLRQQAMNASWVEREPGVS